MTKSTLFLALTLSMCSSFAANFNDSIQTMLDDSVKRYGMPGVQVSIKFANEVCPRNYASGVANKETLEPMRVSEHAMQIGSTTKSFIAATLLMLEDDSEKKKIPVAFNLDQTVGDWLPEYPNYAKVKIRNLLNMTSGIYNYTEDKALFATITKQPNHIFSEDDLIKLSSKHDFYFQIGKGYHYSNTNYVIAGLIIERVTGKPLETVLKERIFKRFPKQLAHTEYNPKPYPSGLHMKMAQGYSQEPLNHKMFYGKNITDYSVTWAGSAGAITSTSEDLANWSFLLFSGKVIPKNKLKEMKSVVCMQAEDGCIPGKQLPKKSMAFGYGLGVGHGYDTDYGDFWTHSGSTLGYSTVFVWIPSQKLSIAIIINHLAPEVDDGTGEFEEENLVILQKLLQHFEQSNVHIKN